MNTLVTRVLIPFLIIAFGAACAGLLVFLAPEAEKAAPTPRVAQVEVFVARPADAAVRVQATGTVRASRQVVLTSEVGGRLVHLAPELEPGGRFRRGEVVARIDPRDYQLAVEQERGRVRQAELELELEGARQETARREWALLGDDRPASEAQLALRKPHLATATRNVEAARAAAERAELQLSRTALVAPFDAVVLEESTALGQLVSPGTPLATLAGTDAFWVELAVPMDRLGVVEIPGVNGEQGSHVTVRQQVGGAAPSTFVGEVIRLGGALDEQTRTARLLVEVRDPLVSGEGGLPLLPGAFVDAEIHGRTLLQVVRVPREAVVDGHEVWVVDEAETLRRRVVEIGWRGVADVYVTAGLVDGDRVVASPLALPLEGMPVRVGGAAEEARVEDVHGAL